MENPAVSLIIVTYNNADLIGPCLESLSRQTYRRFETILVDNNSHDTTVQVAEAYEVRIFPLHENRGFTGGNIEGLRHTNAPYIILLNPDTVPQEDWLENLVAAAVNDSAGICGSKLIVDGTDIIDSAGDGCTVTGKGHKRGEGLHSDAFARQEHVFGACGGAMLIKRDLIEAIGFLDDDFFLIHEDTDLNFRAQLAGWSCLFVPDAIVRHKVGSSIGRMSDLAVYYSVRNARYVLFKNMPVMLIAKHLGEHLIQEALSALFFLVKHRKVRPYIKAQIDFLKDIPSLLVKRRRIMGLKRVSNRELEKMLTPLWTSDFFREKTKKFFQPRGKKGSTL